MLTIRLQRGGRKGHPQYRVIVQDSRFAPSSGRYSALLGTYNPHTKEFNVDTEKATMYLNNGAQPSDRVAALLSKSGVALPKWVKVTPPKSRAIRTADKLRRNRPAEEVAEEAPVAEEVTETVAEETAA